MALRDGVMDLVVGGGDEDLAPYSRVREPNMRMAQVESEYVEQRQQKIQIEQSKHQRLAAEGETTQRQRDSAEKRRKQDRQGVVDRVHAPGGDRGQDFRRMVDFVKLPEDGRFVQEIVRQPKAEIGGQSPGERVDRHRQPDRRVSGRSRTERLEQGESRPL